MGNCNFGFSNILTIISLKMVYMRSFFFSFFHKRYFKNALGAAKHHQIDTRFILNCYEYIYIFQS